MTKKAFSRSLAIILVLVLSLSTILVGCTKEQDTEVAGSDSTGTLFTPGTYEGEGQGFNGPIKVSVTVTENEITKVEVVEHSETENIATSAIEQIPAAIVEHQTVAVDGVTGATGASNGIKEAVKEALLKAGASEDQISKEVKKEATSNVVDLEADVVVVGAGGSGTAAAVTAAENGAKVIVLEKTAIPGGTTANGGGFFAADSRKAREIGHEPVDTDMIFDMWMKEMDWKADANLVRQFLDLSHTTADWLEDRGLVFHKVEEAVQQSHAEGTHAITSMTIIQRLQNN
ncbi:MAG: FAD-dependent oxidoreductase [Tissierellia bacterium]|nr:FAD-dependent oxidoreductase [Tissierellia bacterium]